MRRQDIFVPLVLMALVIITLIIFPMLMLNGCASSPRILHYSWGTIIATDGNSVSRRCTETVGVWDNGWYRPTFVPVGGCEFDTQDGPEFWIEDSEYGWKCVLPHELAHGDGVKDPERMGYGCKGI